MNIYTNGYAFGGISEAQVAATLQQYANVDERIALADFDAGLGYKHWMGRDIEVKEYPEGVYLDTEYKLGEELLTAVSLHTKGVLEIFYAENMGSYGCSYYLHGKKILERLSILGSNLTDEDSGREFKDHATAQVIEHLFRQFTGAVFREAVKEKGKLYLITKQ
jgi:hypothetical protein